eukprot:jgi/Antlo1/2435/2574
MHDSKGFYKILGLEPGSPIEEVKKAYSKLIRLYHPDHGSEMRKAKQIPDEKLRVRKIKELEEICRKINEAKAFLSDEKNKQMYDRGMDPESMAQGPTSFFDILSHLSERGEKKKVKDTVHKVKITFKESFLGKKVKYKIKRRVVCTKCDGKGGEDCRKCEKCNGKGKIQFKTNQLIFVSIQERICDCCNGNKYVVKGAMCKGCGGKRTVNEEKILDVDIPRGIRDGESIVFENQGDEHPEYESGHLVFLVEVVKDPKLVRVRDDIVAKVKVDLFHALTGGTVFFKHVDDRILEVHINKVPSFDKVIMVRGEGFESKKGHGDLYLKPEYVIPDKIDKDKLMAVLPPTIKAQHTGEKLIGQYAELPEEEVVHEQQTAEGFFSEFFF